MPDPSITASGERFARDMHRIREEHGVSMEDIHQETMISTHIIESFEQDGLFEHPTFNRVYLRSFVRSYAKTVGVDPDRAVEELERALKGDYANELAVTYLHDEPEEPPVVAEPEEEADDDELGRREEEEEEGERVPASPVSAAASSSPLGTDEPEEPEPSTEPGTERALPEGSRQGVIIGIGIVIVIVIAWVLVGVLRGTDDAPQSDAAMRSAMIDTAQSDTTRLEPIPAESLQAAAGPSVAIGDTMFFTVIAQERVSPIRIRRDDDLRRPYYIERGQAAVFPAQQRIVIERELGDIRLLVNGHEYPVARHTFNDQLVLSRDTVQAFLDTIRTEPLSLVVPADTFQVLGG